MKRDPREMIEQSRNLPIEPLCPEHTSMLVERLVHYGLKPFLDELRDDPDLVIEQAVDLMNKIQDSSQPEMLTPAEVQQFATPVNFQPMLMATMHIFMLGMQGGCSPFVCSICQLNEIRSPDGVCLCTNLDCEAKDPGSIPPFEEFLDFISARQADWARGNGLIA